MLLARECKICQKLQWVTEIDNKPNEKYTCYPCELKCGVKQRNLGNFT